MGEQSPRTRVCSSRCLCCPAKEFSLSPRLSMSRCSSMGSRFPQRPLPRVTACRRGTWNPFCKHSSAAESCGAFADRAAVTSLRATANALPPMTFCAPPEPSRITRLPDAGSDLLVKVVLPAMASAEHQFGIALYRINVEDMARDAHALNKPVDAPRGPERQRPHPNVHDLDSFGAIPLESKVVRFAGSPPASLPACGRERRGLARWRQPAEAKGHAGHDPDEPKLCA